MYVEGSVWSSMMGGDQAKHRTGISLQVRPDQSRNRPFMAATTSYMEQFHTTPMTTLCIFAVVATSRIYTIYYKVKNIRVKVGVSREDVLPYAFFNTRTFQGMIHNKIKL